MTVKDNDGETPLHNAARSGHVSIVSALIAAGADVDVKGNRNFTPLHYAAQYGHVSVVVALLASGAVVDARNIWSATPLLYAANVSIVSALLAGGADVNAKNNIGRTPLHYAAEYGHVSIVLALIAGGADVNVKGNSDGYTPLRLAVNNGRVSVYPPLLAAGGHWGTACADGNAVNPAGPTPPCVAAAACEAPSVRSAVTNLCDCPAPNYGADGAAAPGHCHDEHALHAAAGAGGLDSFTHLITVHMADVNATTSAGETPLHNAARNGHVSIVATLLAAGAGVNAKENRKQRQHAAAHRRGQSQRHPAPLPLSVGCFHADSGGGALGDGLRGWKCCLSGRALAVLRGGCGLRCAVGSERGDEPLRLSGPECRQGRGERAGGLRRAQRGILRGADAAAVLFGGGFGLRLVWLRGVDAARSFTRRRIRLASRLWNASRRWFCMRM